MADEEHPLLTIDLDEVEAPAFNAEDPQHSKRAKRRKEHKEDEETVFWRQVLATPIGRRVIWKLVERTKFFEIGVFATTDMAMPYPEANEFRRGQQFMGMQLYHELLRRDVFAVHTMHMENDKAFIDLEKQKAKEADAPRSPDSQS